MKRGYVIRIVILRVNKGSESVLRKPRLLKLSGRSSSDHLTARLESVILIKGVTRVNGFCSLGMTSLLEMYRSDRQYWSLSLYLLSRQSVYSP